MINLFTTPKSKVDTISVYEGSIPPHSAPDFNNENENSLPMINSENGGILSMTPFSEHNTSEDFGVKSLSNGRKNMSLDAKNENGSDILNMTPFSIGSIPSHFSTPNFNSEDENSCETTSDDVSFNESGEKEISLLKSLRLKNINQLMVGNLNINSLENKFDHLTIFVENTLDVLIINETKLDGDVANGVFDYHGFQRFRKDRNKHGGGIMVFIRDTIPCKPLTKHNFSKNIEGLFLELNLRKTKLLLFATYHSTHEIYGCSDVDFVEQLSLALDVYSSYDRYF